MRKLRLRAVWLLVLPFLWFARPTPASLSVGAGLAALGVLVRAFAAGYIHKDRQLTTTGPYARTRNPLYLGTFLLGLGVTIGGGRWIFVAVFLVFFALVYGRTIRNEARHLEGLFGDAYRHYARHVPLFFPRLTRYRAPGTERDGGQAGFSGGRWRRNREYEALLGALAGFGFLVLRMYWF
jgi:protein-S-isoprenylcysteine O-methyltransferase Ste14